MTNVVLSTLTALCVAGLGLMGILYGHLIHRMSALEDANRSLWHYTRRLIDLYYRHRHPDAPDPPDLPNDL